MLLSDSEGWINEIGTASTLEIPLSIQKHEADQSWYKDYFLETGMAFHSRTKTEFGRSRVLWN